MSEAVTSRAGAWHQSKVGTILDTCARQYALQYVAQIQTPEPMWAMAGTAYHAAIEAHELARMSGMVWSQADTEAAALSALSAAGAPADLGDEVLAAVYHFFNSPDKELGVTVRDYLCGMTPLKLETYFRTELIDGCLPLAGTFDGLYLDADGNPRLIDHKTAGNFNNWGRNGETHRTQASFYSACLVAAPEFPEVTALPQVDYLVVRKQRGKSKSFDGARIVSVQPDLHDVAVLGRRVREAQHLADEGEFLPNPASMFCSVQWCQFYDRCQGTGELAGPWERVSAVIEGAGTVVEVRGDRRHGIPNKETEQ
jgi:hypothetical protein